MSTQDPYGQAPQDPYGQTPPNPPQDPYGQVPPNPYGQAPQAPYGMPQAPYGQTPQGQVYDPKGMPIAPPYGALPYGVAPKHASATTAMVLGLVGLAGGFVFCGLPFLVSPFAWAIGSKAVKEIDASQGRIGGRDLANIGRITGIVGTVIAILAVLAVVAVFTFGSVVSSEMGTSEYDWDYEDI